MNRFINNKIFDNKHLNTAYSKLVQAQRALALYEIAKYVNDALFELNKLRS